MLEARVRPLVDLCHHLHARGWVANHDGNVSCRLDDGHFLASPTAVSKAEVRAELLVVVDAEGKVVQGTRRVFSEIALHLACYRARPDVQWVVHAHPPHATGWAVTGRSFWEEPFMAEPVVSLGDDVPVVGPDQLEGVMARVDAALLRNHGVLTVGPDAETARLRLELVEHVARIAAVARQLGGARPLDRAEVEKLLEARRKAGLGPEARAAGGGEAPAAGRPDVRALVADALRRLG